MSKTKNTKFTTDYFIEKFEKLDEEDIGERTLEAHCALWHCGVRIDDDEDLTKEALALSKLFCQAWPELSAGDPYFAVSDVNDRTKFGATPRSRILDTLKLLKLRGIQ